MGGSDFDGEVVRESVTIKDGDWSISVTSPDGEGHVEVTVEDGDGQAKRYDLDFDAASGMPSQSATVAGLEHVPAGTNGQCVIRDGQLTITAERPLFDPGTIKLEVDDGVNEPTMHSLDFTEITASVAARREPTEQRESVDQPARAEPLDSKPTAMTDEPTDASADSTDAELSVGVVEPTVDEVELPVDDAESTNGEAESPVGTIESTLDGVELTAGAAESADVDVELTDGEAETGSVDATEQPEQAAGDEQEQITPTPAVHSDELESRPGALVPDQSTGEAEPAGVGQGVPAAADGAKPKVAGVRRVIAGWRAGTGWSVHGDLFDNHDPVYSMHGVLGEDDLEGV